MGHKGEVRIDQAHRGYEAVTDDSNGALASHNPLFLRYAPDARGRYAGQGTYGHQSIERWVDACREMKAGKRTWEEFVGVLPTLQETMVVTRILEAGRKSLDLGGAPVEIV
jgi:D-galacturonate reductase